MQTNGPHGIWTATKQLPEPPRKKGVNAILLAALACVVYATVAWAFDVDNLTIEIPSGSDKFQFKANPSTGDLGLAANQCAMAQNGMVCEGATANTIETYILVTDPTASDKTITFPNESGTVCTTGSVCSGYAASGHNHDSDYLNDDADETYGGATPRTMTFDNAKLSFEGGANGDGTIQIPSGTTAPATCTIGDLFWDTDADTNGSLFVCRATDTWKEVDDDGGVAGLTQVPQRVGSERPVPALAAGAKIYMNASGRLCTTEADCRTPATTGTVNVLSCKSSAAQNADEVKVTIDIDSCSGGAWTFNGSESSIPATANTTDPGSDAASNGGAGNCQNIEIENTGAGAMTSAYIDCEWLES